MQETNGNTNYPFQIIRPKDGAQWEIKYTINFAEERKKEVYRKINKMMRL